jgi:hypothetical protein
MFTASDKLLPAAEDTAELDRVSDSAVEQV